MRKIIEWIGLAAMAVLIFFAGMALQAKTNVSTENENALSNAIMDTVSAMFENENYSADDNEQFVADFIQGLSQKIESKADLTVNVLKADSDAGLLSIEVIETYEQPNGQKKSISCIRTVIFDRKEVVEQELSTYNVKYYTTKDAYLNGDESYKEYNLLEGDEIVKPKNPEAEKGTSLEGKNFKKWYSAESDAEAKFEDANGAPLGIKQDEVYYGVWE